MRHLRQRISLFDNKGVNREWWARQSRICYLLRVKPEVPFFYFFQFHSVFCVFNHLGSLLSLKQVTLEVSSDGVLIRF
jgi:hypothetical protein